MGGIADAAFIGPTICRSCGTCVTECPAKAIQLAHCMSEFRLQIVASARTHCAYSAADLAAARAYSTHRRSRSSKSSAAAGYTCCM